MLYPPKMEGAGKVPITHSGDPKMQTIQIVIDDSGMIEMSVSMDGMEPEVMQFEDPAAALDAVATQIGAGEETMSAEMWDEEAAARPEQSNLMM